MSGTAAGGPRARVTRVGHKGAGLLAPGNTCASFDAALAAGVDMIEFDVLPEHADGSGRLLLAHDYEDAARAGTLELDEGLDHLCSEPFAELKLDIDIKLPGYERRVVDALRERGALGRALVSSTYIGVLDRVRTLEPRLRLGFSVPRARRDYTESRMLAVPALAALALGRRVLPRQAATLLRAGRCDALMAHWRLVTPRLARAVLAAGGELYAWTVDDAARIGALAGLGVTGVITNDPRLFAIALGEPAKEPR